MAKTGKRQTKERGLNVRVTQEQKNSIPGNVRVNSYQKKNKKRLSNEEIAEKIEATKKAEKIKRAETAKKTKKNTKEVSQPTEVTKETVKTAEETAKTTEETVDTVKEAAKEVTKEATKADKEPVDFAGNAEFETMKLTQVEKPEPKIVLRDVEKEKHIDAPKNTAEKEKAAAKKEKAEVKKEELPKAIKTIVYNPVPAPKLSAKEIKEREIEKAVKTASKPDTHKRKARRRLEFGWQRVVLAVACAATAVFAIAYFVNLTSTDMSLKVAAMQSGIEASYPSYIPRGYTLTDVTSATGKVIMHFKNGDDEFGITEESSSWDSEALLNEYVKENYGNEYTLVREQGLTLYMGGNWEAWVNGGVLYKLSVTSGSLTKKQMKSIAVSM